MINVSGHPTTCLDFQITNKTRSSSLLVQQQDRILISQKTLMVNN